MDQQRNIDTASDIQIGKNNTQILANSHVQA
ncbi:hypothetical protein EOE67_05880 [Rheinheimera riviphila]|uniref:Uncharacterized protein n=1 Tax=Rheinheimera riviphila TaxID=1834037 RepID=A0A437R1P5_9GAMM|nr:hypothetical protein EOE67_05880 [Rheinheimera riviphila]